VEYDVDGISDIAEKAPNFATKFVEITKRPSFCKFHPFLNAVGKATIAKLITITRLTSRSNSFVETAIYGHLRDRELKKYFSTLTSFFKRSLTPIIIITTEYRRIMDRPTNI